MSSSNNEQEVLLCLLHIVLVSYKKRGAHIILSYILIILVPKFSIAFYGLNFPHILSTKWYVRTNLGRRPENGSVLAAPKGTWCSTNSMGELSNWNRIDSWKILNCAGSSSVEVKILRIIMYIPHMQYMIHGIFGVWALQRHPKEPAIHSGINYVCLWAMPLLEWLTHQFFPLVLLHIIGQLEHFCCTKPSNLPPLGSRTSSSCYTTPCCGRARKEVFLYGTLVTCLVLSTEFFTDLAQGSI
jgi:hypothetical protein